MSSDDVKIVHLNQINYVENAVGASFNELDLMSYAHACIVKKTVYIHIYLNESIWSLTRSPNVWFKFQV